MGLSDRVTRTATAVGVLIIASTVAETEFMRAGLLVSSGVTAVVGVFSRD